MSPHAVKTIARSVLTFGNKQDSTFGTHENTFGKRACELRTFGKYEPHSVHMIARSVRTFGKHDTACIGGT